MNCITFSHLLRLQQLLELDQDRLRARDIGKALRGAPSKRLFQWARLQDHSQTRQNAESYISLGTALLGLFLGWLSGQGVFFYSGKEPINVVLVIGLYVLLPSLLLIVSIIAFVLSNRSRPAEVPLPFFAKRIFGEKLLNSFAKQRVLYSRVHRWFLFSLGQWFGLWFYSGALVSFLGLVIFSDLAFGWSTTLDIEPQEFLRWTGWLAWPWSNVLPSAMPSEELVQLSRFYRMKGVSSANSEVLGQWWAFVVCAVGFYGLLPRILLWAFARTQLQWSIHQTALQLPGARELLSQMASSLIETKAPEQTGQLDEKKASVGGESFSPLPIGACYLIDWAGAPNLIERLHAHRTQPRIQRSALTEEDTIFSEIGSLQEDCPILVAVRGWEVPTAEVIDFLKELRKHLGPQTRLFVLIDGYQPDSLWPSLLQRLGDPFLIICRLEDS